MNDIEQLINAAIAHELAMAELYRVFCETAQEDSAFWWELSMEEQNHATLLESAKETLAIIDQFPMSLVPQSLIDLDDANTQVQFILQQYTERPPVSREETFRIALALEVSTGELHFQAFMQSSPKSALHKLFQTLNREDTFHAQRIQTYLDETGLKIAKIS